MWLQEGAVCLPEMSTLVVKRGYVNVKEDGLRSFLWSKRWLILREQTLTFHKNEVDNFDIANLSSTLPCLPQRSRKGGKDGPERILYRAGYP